MGVGLRGLLGTCSMEHLILFHTLIEFSQCEESLIL